MTPEQLSAAIRAALQSAVDAGDLAITVPAEVRVERPRNRDHGDWSTNIALQLAKGAGIPPRELATALARFADDGFVNRDTADVWVSGPHFHAANVTIPSMMLAMVTVLVLAVTVAVQGRSRKESSPSVGTRL